MARASATLTIHGPQPLLRALRKHLTDALREEAPDTTVSEHRQAPPGAPDKGEGETPSLAFQLRSPGGLPYPPLAAVSAQFPDCVFEIAWEQAGERGNTVLRAGQAEQATRTGEAVGGPPCAVRADAQGRLLYALTVVADGAHQLGYCATAAAETYFRIGGGASAPLLETIGGDRLAWDESWRLVGGVAVCEPAPAPRPLTAGEHKRLEKLAADFRALWLWYEGEALEATIVERQRFESAGRAIAPINVKSRRLESLAQADGYSSLGASAHWVASLLTATWIAAALSP